MPAKQGTNFLLTDFSVDQDLYNGLINKEGVRFITWQRELAPDTGREHFQAFLQLKEKKTATWVKELLGTGAHIEIVKKIRCDEECRKAQEFYDANKDVPTVVDDKGKEKMQHSPCGYHYCRKLYTRVDGPYEQGDRVGAGARTDLLEVQEKIKQGANIEQIYDEHFEASAKYNKFFKEYRSMKASRRTWTMEVIVIWGRTGDGKTQKAYETVGFGKDVFEVKDDKNFPFTSYDGQEKILWDEFSGSSCDIKYLLRLMDRYPLQVRGLQHYYEFLGKTLVITSNYPPWEWYRGAGVEHVKALNRRLREFGTIVHKEGDEWLEDHWNMEEPRVIENGVTYIN